MSVVDQKVESQEESKDTIPPANDTQEKDAEQAPKETDKRSLESLEQKEIISENTEQTESSESSEQSETLKTQYKKLNGPKLTGKKN